MAEPPGVPGLWLPQALFLFLCQATRGLQNPRKHSIFSPPRGSTQGRTQKPPLRSYRPVLALAASPMLHRETRAGAPLSRTTRDHPFIPFLLAPLTPTQGEAISPQTSPFLMPCPLAFCLCPSPLHPLRAPISGAQSQEETGRLRSAFCLSLLSLKQLFQAGPLDPWKVWG